MVTTEGIANAAAAPKKWNPITALNSLANVSLDASDSGQKQKAAALLLEQIHPGKSDTRMGLILNDKDRGNAREVAELWADENRRKKFLEDTGINSDEDIGEMWEATTAWLDHANNPIPQRLIEYVDEAVTACKLLSLSTFNQGPFNNCRFSNATRNRN